MDVCGVEGRTRKRPPDQGVLGGATQNRTEDLSIISAIPSALLPAKMGSELRERIALHGGSSRCFADSRTTADNPRQPEELYWLY